MRTVKLVVIGASGVGKTSLRNQYISGRFTTGYRATIGADFITKTLPHYSLPDESVTLQIWDSIEIPHSSDPRVVRRHCRSIRDTAGQERFSSLSSAFFRGADAALLMFDVNQPDTLTALQKWWTEFREKAPVPDDEIESFCCVVVGNKIDIAEANGEDNAAVTETDALRFIDKLVPPSSAPSSPFIELTPVDEDDVGDGPSKHAPIDIGACHRRRRVSGSRSRSRSTLFRGGTVGTATTTHTIYHTPSSSFFDTFESALSSPAHTQSSLSAPTSRSHSPLHSPRRVSFGSSISSAPTITPSLFIRGQAATTVGTTPASNSPPLPSYNPPPPPKAILSCFLLLQKRGKVLQTCLSISLAVSR
ncbi:GTP-binding protein YPTC5 [Grifola frondosa]|uniref:GTP-binding protein YPTC5 n=1 Tax=Grifola frondosa TaxID=5627 RepID=A0A1C7MRY4_GRIFR|nr:GTP-binding protein YPTC5 [Grifola frondosa]